MGDQLLGIELSGLQDIQQHRRADRVDQSGGDGDVAVPETFQMQLHLGAMHADIGDVAARRDDLLAQFECRRNADRLDGGIDAPLRRHFHHRFGRVAVGAVDGRGGAEAFCDFQAVVIQVDHDDLGRRVELRRQQRRQADRPRTDDGDGAARLHLAVEHAAFEARGQDIAQHHQGFFVHACGNGIEAGVGMGYADIFRLGAVYRVAQNPAARRAMRIHRLAAVDAFAAGADAGDQNTVARLESRDGGADGLDDAHAFMTENAAGLAGRDVAFENMQIGAADRGLGDPDDGVAYGYDRFRMIDDRFLAGRQPALQ